MDAREAYVALNMIEHVGPVRVRQVGEYGYNFMRLSTHIYNGPDQVDRVVELLGKIAAE